MLPTRPGRDELVKVRELLGINPVLLSVRPAGVVSLDDGARRVPVTSDEMFPLGEIKGGREELQSAVSKEHDWQKKAFTSKCAGNTQNSLCVWRYDDTETVPVRKSKV